MARKYAVVGCGGIGTSSHLPAAKRLEEAGRLEIVAVCDIVEDRVRLAAERFGERPYTDTGEMLRRESPDIVDVCTPEEAHAGLAVQALEAGADVICEKTMADTIENARGMLEASRRTGRRLAINYNYRFLSPYLALRRVIEAGELGEIRNVAAAFHWNQGTHSIDMMRNLGGEVAEVCGAEIVEEREGEFRGRRRAFRMRSSGAALLRFESGALGTMSFTHYPRPGRFGFMNFIVVGTQKQAVVPATQGDLTIYAPDRPPVKPELPQPNEWVASFQRSIGAFLRSIEEGTPHPVTGEDGLKAMQIDAAITASRISGGWVKPYGEEASAAYHKFP